jgi:hypothetical protein
MYQPYPAQAPPPQPAVPATRPAPVRLAVRLMYAGAVLSVAAAVAALLGRHALLVSLRLRDPNLTAHQVRIAHDVVTGGAVAGGIIGAGLWIWMAWANGRGRNWARVLSAVLFGIYTLDLLSLLRGHLGPLPLVITALTWLTGLTVIILIFRRESGPFYRQPGYPAAGYPPPPYPQQGPYQAQGPYQQGPGGGLPPQSAGPPPPYQQPSGAPPAYPQSPGAPPPYPQAPGQQPPPQQPPYPQQPAPPRNEQEPPA